MNASIDGLVSGMDTTALIRQLMQLERQPVARLEARRSRVQDVIDAYRSLNTRMDAIRSAGAALATASKWSVFRATSSSDALTATAASGASPGSISLNVLSRAAGHMVASSGSVSSTSVVVADGPLQLTKGGVALDPVDVGDGSLASVVGAVNGAGLGVTASVLRVSDTEYRLVLSSTTTGADTTIAVTGGLNGALGAVDDTLTAAADAVVEVGETSPVTVTSRTNTLTDLLPGVTVTVKAAGAATVTVERDGEGLADKVQSLVEAANAALEELKRLTSYDAATKKAGLLLGDGTAARLQSAILRAVTEAVGSSPLGAAAGAGVASSREGLLTFDRAAFLSAYADDPSAVEALFRQGAAVDRAGLEFVRASDRTRLGTYTIDVTTVAERGSVASAALPGGVTVPGEAITIDVAGNTASYTVASGDSADTVARRLNEELAANGVAASARVDGAGRLVVETAAYGSQAAVSVTSSGGLFSAGTATDAGVDVAGTISYLDASGATVTVAASGSGRLLSAPSGDAVVGGLVMRATEGGTFELRYTPGVAQRLTSLAADAVDTVSGSLTLAVEGRESRLRAIDDAIEGWEARLVRKEEALRRQFSALEAALGRLRNQSDWLGAQVAGLLR